MLNCLRWIRGAAVGLAAFGTVIPHNAPVQAAERKAPQRIAARSVDTKMFDVALSAGGTFTGRVVDHTGAAIEGSEVIIRQGQTEVARAISDRSGSFTVSNLKNGVYTFTAGSTSGTYRLWSEKTAPPSANAQGLLILGENGARGQFAAVDCGGNLLIAAITLAALGVAIATLIEVEDLKGKIPTSP